MTQRSFMLFTVVLTTFVMAMDGNRACAQFVVDKSGGGTHTSIQSAVDDAEDGFDILVKPGTYAEHINFKGKAVHVRSSDPQDPDIVGSTIIDGFGTGHVVTFESGETSESILEGFTVTNGSDDYGAGIYCVGASSPIIQRNTITANYTVLHGTAIYCAGGSSPLILNNEIVDNESDGRGVGIYAEASSARIEANLIDDNITFGSSGGGIHLGAGTDGVVVINNQISFNQANYGGGLNIEDSNPKVWRNLIIGNVGTQRAGGISLIDAAPMVENNYVEGNWSPIAAAMDCNNAAPAVRGNTFTGNYAAESAVILLINGSEALFEGNVIAHHEFGWAIQSVIGTSAEADYNCFYNNLVGDVTGDVTLGEHNLYSDPQLVSLGFWQVPVGIKRGGDDYRVEATLAGFEDLEGFSEYRLEPDRERFQLDVLNFEPFTSHDIFLNGEDVGDISIKSDGTGEMEYDTNDGNFPPWFPMVLEGDVLNVGGLITGIFGPEGGGTSLIWNPGDGHLQPTSPCINVWDTSDNIGDGVDIDGQPRSYGQATEIGMDEWLPNGTGDFDGDGDVDLVDFGAFQRCRSLSGQIGVEPACVPGDFDGDEDVDLIDYANFVSVTTGPG